MDKIYIKVDKKTGMIYLENTVIGRDKENLQQELIFSFENGFVLGSPRLEYKIGNNRYHIPMERIDETYVVPIKNILTVEGKIEMQLVITQVAQNEEIPVFKSNVFYMYCDRSINAQEEPMDDYEYWLDVIEEKLAEVDEALDELDNVDIDATKSGNTATVSITNKEGITKSVEIYDGENGQDGYSPTATVSKTGNTSTITITDKNGTTTANIQDGENGTDGIDGKDAKINGVNTISIEAGENITLDQEGNTLTINSTGGGTSNYTDLTNKPKINNIELKGNKSLNDLGIQPAGNYALESEIPTKVSDLTNDSGFITGYTETDPTVPSYVKNITQSNITSWNNKYDKPNGGIPKTDLASTVQTSLNKADTAIQEHQDISGKEDKTNKVTSIDNTSTDTQYPSAKCVHDSQATQDDEIEALQTENERLKATLPTTTGEGQDITLNKTAEMEFVKPPLPMGNSEQVQYSGKNWLPIIPTESKTLNGITLTSNGDGSFTVNGTATESTSILFDLITPVHLPNQTIYVHLRNPSISDFTMIFKGSGRQSTPGLNVVNRIMSSPNLIDMELTQIGINVDSGKTVKITFTPSLELTDTVTEYEPYVGGTASPNPDYPQEITNVTGNVEVTISNENNTESKTLPVSLGNIELRKIGNYQDYLYKNNGKWYKYNAINKLVLNGSENWSVHGSIASWFFLDGVTDGFTNNTIIGYALSNYFTQKAYNTVTSLNNGEFAYGQVAGETRKRFVIKDTDYTTVANFKSWLSTHNTIVYYVLATPTSTEITDVTLISQLEEILKALSYQGQTNITSNTITMFDVEAYQSTKLILENLDSRLTLVEG